MDKLSDITPRLPTLLTNGGGSVQSESGSSNQMSARAERVWFRMGELYGKAWENHHGNVPPPAWVMRIGELSDSQIKRGLAELSVTEETFYPVPDLARFTTYCTKGANVAEKWCAWPIFDGVPVGIPKMNLVQQNRYERGDYDNVPLHRAWINKQPYANGKLNPERAVLEAMWAAKQENAA